MEDSAASQAGRPSARIVVAISSEDRAAFLPSETMRSLESLGRVECIEPAHLREPSAFARTMASAEVLVTAWGAPRLTADRLRLAPRLRLVAHAASSVRAIVSDAFWDSGIPVTQAGSAMSRAVAELSLTLTLTALRRAAQMDHMLRRGDDWQDVRDLPRPREIAGRPIGVIGASRTGRAYIEMCRALGADVRVTDPYLASGDDLHAIAVPLDVLLERSDVVALHAPQTDETVGLLGAEELARIPDGGVVVNTARAAIVDDDALYAEVAAGRLDAALDVHAEEPLPLDDRWRALDNVVLTGHRGGATVESRRRAGSIVVDEIRRHLAHEPLHHEIVRADAARMG